MSSSVTMTNANCTLSYYSATTGENVARVRCPQVSMTYTQNSAESHSREHRAYYPHRRSQGSFMITIDNKGWKEFQAVMQWFRDYATSALDMDSSPTSPPMNVSIPSRNFTRVGIPTTGTQFGDFLGSMVFSPQITFISVSDPDDPSSSILSQSQVSNTAESTAQAADPASNYFYPDSLASYPGQLSTYLYDTFRAAQDGAIAVQAALGITPQQPNTSGRVKAV